MISFFRTIKYSDIIKNGYLSYIGAISSIIILPIHVQYLPPFMMLWALGWVIENYNFRNISIVEKNTKILLGFFIIYYIWQLISLLYTADMELGLSNLFGRLSLLLFPLLLAFPGSLIKNKIKTLIRAFAISTLVFIFICFCYALIRSFNYHVGSIVFDPHPAYASWLNFFYSAELTITQHPTYIAMYVLLSTFISFESWFDNNLEWRKRLLWLVSGILLIVSQYFLSSRAGILTSLVLLPVYFVIKFRKTGRTKFAWLWIVLVTVALIPIVIKNQRVDYLYSKLLNKTDYNRKEDPRLKIWKSSFHIASENFLLGVGIGDVRSSLAIEYERIGETGMAKERLNAHNQFIEVLVENGIIGLIIFVSILGFMLQLAFSKKNILYIFFLFMIIMFFMFETMLYRLAGVSFFSMFSFLFVYYNSEKQSFNSITLESN